MREESSRKFTTITRTTTSTYGASGSRSAFGYWIPLALTVTAATVGLAAWIWSERTDEDETSESEAEQYYASSRPSKPNQGGSGYNDAAGATGAAGLGAAAGYASMSGGLPPGPGPQGAQPQPPGSFNPGPPAQGGFQGGPAPPEGGAAASYFRDEQSRAMSTGVAPPEDQGFVARMSNAMGLSRNDAPSRTQQTNEGGSWATRSLAAAGSIVEGAVKSVRGSAAEAGEHFSDQEKWSEEADKPERTNSMSPRKSTGSVAVAAALGASIGGLASTRGSANESRRGTAAEFYTGAVDAPRRSSVSRIKRKTIAIIVSSLEKGDGMTEVDAHLSILSQLPEYFHPDTTRIFVLIYAPDLNTHPLSAISRRASERRESVAPSARSHSISSYAKINTPGANGTPSQTPGEFPQERKNNSSDDQGILAHVDPHPMDSNASINEDRASARGSRTSFGDRENSSSQSRDRKQSQNNTLDPVVSNPLDQETTSLFKTLYNQANALVDQDTSILPFTSQQGHKHILRSIQPEIVYIQEPLCGESGSLVTELQGWVRQVVVVIGDEGGMGGLVDSDTEEEDRMASKSVGGKWWRNESVTGVGRGVSVVESLRVGEDWRRRVNEEE